MNFKILIDPRKAEGHPFEIFFVGFIYALLSVLLGKWIFPAYASIAMLAVVVAACVPLIFLILNYEERQDKRYKTEFMLLNHHRKALTVFTFLFFGFTAGFLLWFSILPANEASYLFEAQLQTIAHINKQPISGYAYAEIFSFTTIFFNNIKVLGFILLFSLIFSAGSVLILAWNASVIATAIGTFIFTKLSSQAGYTISEAVSYSAVRYLIHAIPEVIGYVTASLVGGIIYIALVRKELTKRMLIDATVMLTISLVFIFIAALLEVNMTPIFYR